MSITSHGVGGLLVAITAWACVLPPARAADYPVQVTRKGNNLYGVADRRMVIHTRRCREPARGALATLQTGARTGVLVFGGGGARCVVRAVYGPAESQPGKYTVRVTRDGDDWYAVDGNGTFLRTTRCLAIVVAQEAVLSLRGEGGTLEFPDGQECTLEGVYSRIRL